MSRPSSSTLRDPRQGDPVRLAVALTLTALAGLLGSWVGLLSLGFAVHAVARPQRRWTFALAYLAFAAATVVIVGITEDVTTY